MTNVDKAKESKSFCIYPWVHQYVGPGGEVKACCVYKPDVGTLKENTLAEIWNNDHTKQMRLDMLEGKQIKGCDKCDSRVGLSSNHRDIINRLMFSNDDGNQALVNSTLSDGSLPNHQLQFIDARFNNLCNLKCRTCGIMFSTSWHEDHVKLFGPTKEGTLTYPGKTENQLLDEILPHVPYLKRIYFAGGEPLMQIEHFKVLEELIRIGHVGTKEKPLYIYYNTNFTNLKLGKYYALDMWKKFDNLAINASLDGSHAKAEYWRKGSDWNKIVQNRKDMIMSCPNTVFQINYTLSWVNAYNLVEFHKEWVEMGLLGVDDMLLNILDTPVQFSLKSIPTWKKKKIEIVLNNHIDWLKEQHANDFIIQSFRDAITYMYSIDTGEDFMHREKFLRITTKTDEIRGENFWDVFPEHQDMKDYCNV